MHSRVTDGYNKAMKQSLSPVASILAIAIAIAGVFGQPVRSDAADSFSWQESESVSISRVSATQGDPVRIEIKGARSAQDVLVLAVNGKILPVFSYDGAVQALYGIDLNAPVGTVPVIVLLEGQRYAIGMLDIALRERPTLGFTIPDSLGGTTPQGEQNVATLLTRENAVLSGVSSDAQRLWSGPFRYPVTDPFVTDPYGYSRDTGTQLVSHKGTDFRATPGTEVRAVNAGIVRLATSFSIYGKTVIVDHGQGVMSFYMHLSEIAVAEGARVGAGDVLGRSGQTGYAEGPHLHLTVRLNGVSVDPMRMLELYGR